MSSKPDPKSRAAAIIDALPGNSILSKTGILSAGTALAAIAISKEFYVFNDETVLVMAAAGLM
jgi:F-type H+-transporting ATPase subunit b